MSHRPYEQVEGPDGTADQGRYGPIRAAVTSRHVPARVNLFQRLDSVEAALDVLAEHVPHTGLTEAQRDRLAAVGNFHRPGYCPGCDTEGPIDWISSYGVCYGCVSEVVSDHAEEEL